MFAVAIDSSALSKVTGSVVSGVREGVMRYDGLCRKVSDWTGQHTHQRVGAFALAILRGLPFALAIHMAPMPVGLVLALSLSFSANCQDVSNVLGGQTYRATVYGGLAMSDAYRCSRIGRRFLMGVGTPLNAVGLLLYGTAAAFFVADYVECATS